MDMKAADILTMKRDFMINMNILPRRASFLCLFIHGFDLFSVSPSWDPITQMPNPNKGVFGSFLRVFQPPIFNSIATRRRVGPVSILGVQIFPILVKPIPDHSLNVLFVLVLFVKLLSSVR